MLAHVQARRDQPSLEVDSVVGNVTDLEAAVAALRATGLKPFLRFELSLDDRLVPIALYLIGSVTLELLGAADDRERAGAARIHSVRVESRRATTATAVYLGPDCVCEVGPGPRSRLVGVTVETPTVESDAAWLETIGGERVGGERVGDDGAVGLRLGATAVELVARPGGPRPPEGEFFPGWHRIGLACHDVDATVASFSAAGLVTLTPAYRVMPGLREAMLYLPSGLVVQPVSQTLWKMLPVIAWRKALSVLTRKPIRFTKTTGAS